MAKPDQCSRADLASTHHRCKELMMVARQYIEIGTRFNRLTYLGDAFTSSKHRRALFKCDCGKEFEARLSHATSGDAKSCGCLLADMNIARSKHGNARRDAISAEYRCWAGMRKRCENPNDRAFDHYGGRGIKVCERWSNFENFIADVGPRPSQSHSLDRYPDVNGNYEPGNVRWATDLEQANNKRITPMVEYQGRIQSIADWARELGFKYWTVRNRIVNLGWSVEKSFTTPAVLGRNQFT